MEVARLGDGAIHVRDTQNTLTRLAFGPDEWRRFTEDAKEGRFDHP